MGVEKAFLDIAGRPMVQWTLERLAGLGEETIIVTNAPEQYDHLAGRLVTDLYRGRGTLGGLYTGLYYSHAERTLVVACDMPFLNRQLLRYQILLSRDFDVVVPRVGEWLEPLHAVYSSSCMKPIKAIMDRGGYRVGDLYQEVRVRYVEASEIEMFDREHRSFLNVNTPDELEYVRRLATETLVDS
jgi:molybdopterin-guanine dinucleotide biosynthesis protein A